MIHSRAICPLTVYLNIKINIIKIIGDDDDDNDNMNKQAGGTKSYLINRPDF